MTSFSDLIKGKKKVKTWTTTDMVLQEIVESDVLDETIKRLILKKVQTGYSSRDYALDYANTGAAQFFQYYLSGKYDFSDVLPTVTLGGAGTPLALIQNVLNTKYNENIEILEYFTLVLSHTGVSAFTTPPNVSASNMDILIKAILSSKYDYDYLTNTLYYNNLTYEYIHRDFGVTGGRSWTDSEINTDTDRLITVVLRQKNTTSTDITLTLNIDFSIQTRYSSGSMLPISWYTTTYPFYFIPYKIPSTGRSKLLLYPPLKNNAYWDTRYPELDLESFDSRDEIGSAIQYNSFESYPIVTLRENKIDINSLSNGTTTEQKRYNETVAMLNNLGIPLEDVTNAYLDSSIDNVQITGSSSVTTVLKDAFIQLGVSPAHTEEVVSKCLFDFFENIYKELPNSLNSFFYPYTLLIEEGNLNTYYEWVPREKIKQTNTTKLIGSYWHTCEELPESARTETKNVKVGASYTEWWVGTGGAGSQDQKLMVFFAEAEPPDAYYVISHFGASIVTHFEWEGISYDLDINQIRAFINNSQSSTGVGSFTAWNHGELDATLSISVDKVYRLSIHHQISETEEEIIYVDNLRSWSGVLKGETKVENLLMKDGVPNSHFLIPLSVKLIENMSFIQRTDLLSHCVHLCLYIFSNYKLVYREGGILKKLLQVLSVVITVLISIVAPAAGAAMSGSLSIMSGTAIANVFSNLFSNFLIGMALSVALKVVMKLTGNETLNMILSTVVLTIGVYLSGGFEGALDSLTGTLKTAVELAEIPLKIVETYASNVLKETMSALSALQTEATSFFNKYTEYADQYNEIIKGLNSGISTEFLVGLQGMSSYTSVDMNAWLMSPSAFMYSAIQGQFDIDSLFRNDVETYVSNKLAIGVIG